MNKYIPQKPYDQIWYSHLNMIKKKYSSKPASVQCNIKVMLFYIKKNNLDLQ